MWLRPWQTCCLLAGLIKLICWKQEKTVQYDSQDRRELTFDDLILGDYVSSGSCNIVSEVELPDWWHQQYTNQERYQQGYFQVDKNTDLIVKIAVYADWGDLEISALDKLNADKDLAATNKILPLIWGGETFDNPFYAGEDGNKTPQREVPESLMSEREVLRKAKTISAMVVPNLYSLGQMRQIYALRTLQEVRRFMRSLFLTLDHANSVGVNNNDMTVHNVRCDNDGNAIFIDWNGMHLPNEEIYEEDAAFEIIPPEGILEKVPVFKNDGSGEEIMKKVTQTSISSYDIWSAGILFANAIFWPCKWIYTDSNDEYNLGELMKSVGGNAKIRVNDEGDEADLASAVGLDLEDIAQSVFEPPLCRNRRTPCARCNARSFSVLDSNGEELKAKALDFLERMMVLAPQDRPTAKELLQHPFLNEAQPEMSSLNPEVS